MAINAQNKGKDAERQLANELNTALNGILAARGIPIPPVPYIQRNQNQSAVGGKDLTGTFDLCMEIKRQEALAINTWWAQTTVAAKRNNEMPILLYKQNHQPWKVIMPVELPIPSVSEGQLSSVVIARAQIDWLTFMQWFRQYAAAKIEQGFLPKM